MRNRFNINEDEKNRIKGLHGINLITEQTDYSDEEGVTLTIDKGFDYEGEMSRTQIIETLWQVQSLLQDCKPAISLTRVVEMLSRLGEDVNMLDRDFGDCNCDGSGKPPVESIDE